MSFYESLSAAADNYGPADLQTLAAYRAWVCCFFPVLAYRR